MDQKLEKWLKKGSLIAFSNANPLLPRHHLSRAFAALHSNIDWVCLEGCYALIRHKRNLLDPEIVTSVESLYARAKDNIPIIATLTLALMSLPTTTILSNKGLAKIAYESAKSVDTGVRANAAAVLKRLAGEGDIVSQELIRKLREDLDERVRINSQLEF